MDERCDRVKNNEVGTRMYIKTIYEGNISLRISALAFGFTLIAITACRFSEGKLSELRGSGECQEKIDKKAFRESKDKDLKDICERIRRKCPPKTYENECVTNEGKNQDDRDRDDSDRVTGSIANESKRCVRFIKRKQERDPDGKNVTLLCPKIAEACSDATFRELCQVQQVSEIGFGSEREITGGIGDTSCFASAIEEPGYKCHDSAAFEDQDQATFHCPILCEGLGLHWSSRWGNSGDYNTDCGRQLGVCRCLSKIPVSPVNRPGPKCSSEYDRTGSKNPANLCPCVCQFHGLVYLPGLDCSNLNGNWGDGDCTEENVGKELSCEHSMICNCLSP